MAAVTVKLAIRKFSITVVNDTAMQRQSLNCKARVYKALNDAAKCRTPWMRAIKENTYQLTQL